jgi:nicotinate-nucleotide adenylyltransferase
MIGIFGGTFDPVHYGHLRTALDVQQALSLSEVRFIPCGEPPHRNKPIAEPLQRLAMVRASIAGQAYFTVDDREIRRGGPSYMVDTLASLKNDFKAETLCLMLGTDAFNGLPRWHCWQELFELANIVVMQRPADDSTSGSFPGLSAELCTLVKQRHVSMEKLDKKPHGAICFVPVTQLAISATTIRQQWQQGKDIRFYTPDSVLTLIRQQDIY